MDIDINFASPEAALAGLRFVRASRLERGKRIQHPSGVYFQDIPVDPLDGLTAWSDKETAVRHGFFKIDFLTLKMYQDVRDEDHLDCLLNTEPNWDDFLDRDIVSQLLIIHDHYDIVASIAPRSVYDLAVSMALIMPSKEDLRGKPRADIERDIWKKTPRYCYKRAHAVAYALQTIAQLNLLKEKAQQP